jgi:hypothetical protein
MGCIDRSAATRSPSLFAAADLRMVLAWPPLRIKPGLIPAEPVRQPAVCADTMPVHIGACAVAATSDARYFLGPPFGRARAKDWPRPHRRDRDAASTAPTNGRV